MKIYLSTLLIFFITLSCRDNNEEVIVINESSEDLLVDDIQGSSIEEFEEMVMIPAGEFEMGASNNQADQDEYPKHMVKVKEFLMDVHEVTNLQFKTFVDETGYLTLAEKPIDWEEFKQQLPPGTPKPDESWLQPGSMVFIPTSTPVSLNDSSQWWHWVNGANWKHPEGPGSTISDRMNHPVVHIAYVDALAYAEWAGKRLPTEAEWEWASRGGLEDPVYPWGNKPAEQAADLANFWQGLFPVRDSALDGYNGTAPVMSYPPNGYGLFDMAGNVWEWCEDWYNSNAYKIKKQFSSEGPDKAYDPHDPQIPKRVIRGGSFLCNDTYCSGYRVSRRMKSSEDSGLNHTGFRCVKDKE